MTRKAERTALAKKLGVSAAGKSLAELKAMAAKSGRKPSTSTRKPASRKASPARPRVGSAWKKGYGEFYLSLGSMTVQFKGKKATIKDLWLIVGNPATTGKYSTFAEVAEGPASELASRDDGGPGSFVVRGVDTQGLLLMSKTQARKALTGKIKSHLTYRGYSGESAKSNPRMSPLARAVREAKEDSLDSDGLVVKGRGNVWWIGFPGSRGLLLRAGARSTNKADMWITDPDFAKPFRGRTATWDDLTDEIIRTRKVRKILMRDIHAYIEDYL